MVVLLVSILCNCRKGTRMPGPEIMELRGRTMGTSFMIKVVKPVSMIDTPTSKLTADIAAGVDTLLKDINLQMSTWIKESEISRFNDYRDAGWFSVSPGTVQVFAEAKRISVLSGGAFDITVGPLINLWGFGPTKKEQQIPTVEQISAIMSKVGYQKVSVQLAPAALKKAVPELRCNLSALAKGYGVDMVGKFLEEQGYGSYLVEIGGEVRTKGSKQKNKLWRVAIAAPGPNGKSPYQKVLPLRDMSMATSGDYFNYFEKDGVRYSHTIDPTTGKPITHKLASVTVLHPSCMTADALATVINVMGPEKGFRLAVRENLAAFFVVRETGSFIEKMTPAFKVFLEKK